METSRSSIAWRRGVLLAVLVSAGGIAWAYNGPTHAKLFRESLEHLRRLGHRDAYDYFVYRVGVPDPREGVEWPDFSTTSKRDGNLAEYALCYTSGCADPGDGDDEGKNLDSTRWGPRAKSIRDALISFGYERLGAKAMATAKAAAEHQYAPDSRVTDWQIYIELNFTSWPHWRITSVGPTHWRSAYAKVGEYAGLAISSANHCDARPGFVWAARAMHFFQDMTCPQRTSFPDPEIRLGILDGSWVVAVLRSLRIVNQLACYGSYADWIEATGDTYLWEIRAHPERFPINLWPGDFAAASRETLNTIARWARGYSGDTDCAPPDDYPRAAAALLPTAVRIGAELLYNYYARVAGIPEGPPPAPSHLMCNREGSVNTLTWRDNSGNEDGFRIYEGLGNDCGDRVLLGEVGPDTTSFSWRSGSLGEPPDPEPFEPQTCYVVEAWNHCGSRTAQLLSACRGSEPGCPYVASWNGAEFVEDNNILRVRSDDASDAVDPPDAYLLREEPVPCGGRHTIAIFERGSDRSDIDSVELFAVDHDPAHEIAVTSDGRILSIGAEAWSAAPEIGSGVEISGLVTARAEVPPDAIDSVAGDAGLLIETPPRIKSIIGIEILGSPNNPALLTDGDPSGSLWTRIGEVRTRENGGRSIVAGEGLAKAIGDARDSGLPLVLRFAGVVAPVRIALVPIAPQAPAMRPLELQGALHSTLGDVSELLRETDGRRASIGPGEEIVFQFWGEGPPAGTRRGFVLLAVGSYILGEGLPAFFQRNAPEHPFFRGDANGDGRLNIADAIRLLHHLFGAEEPEPVCCEDVLDANDDGRINVADAIRLLHSLFGHADPLPSGSARDATADSLYCPFGGIR